jgi:hypothetical protein
MKIEGQQFLDHSKKLINVPQLIHKVILKFPIKPLYYK